MRGNSEWRRDVRHGVVPMAGTTTLPATSVTVNGSNATLYSDSTFAKSGFTPVNGNNTYTAIAQDSLSRLDTNSITVYLPTNAVYAYDQNGNLTNDSKRVFTYDDENQLTGIVVSNEWKAEFVYDGKMRRRIERNYEWRNSAWVKTSETRFVYDGNVVIQERNENNTPVVTLTRGKDLSGSLEGAGGIGGLLAMTENSKLNLQNSSLAHNYFHADGNGNVTMLIDTNQHAAARYIYDPFGRTLSKSGPLADANRYQFSSKPLHDRSGLYDYLYRWYAPEIQRWLNRDPLRERGFTELVNVGSRIISRPTVDRRAQHRVWPSLKHLYSYSFNQPVTRWDPWGLDSPGCDFGILPASPAVLECCAIHDECSDHNGCTSRSWLTCAFRWRWACAGCNADVTACLIDAPNTPDDPDRPNFYCAVCGVYFDIGGNDVNNPERNPHFGHTTDR